MKKSYAYITSNPYYPLKVELVTTHLKIKNMIVEKKLSSSDYIVTEPGREFLYTESFKNVINTEQLKKKNNLEIVDLTNSQEKIQKYSDKQIAEYKKFTKTSIKPSSDKRYVCLSFRNSTRSVNCNSDSVWFRNMIRRLRDYFDEIFITGRGSHQFIDENVTVVNLQEWCTLINSTQCEAIVTNMNGACQAARFFSSAEKLIEIDLENKNWELNDPLITGLYPQIIKSEILKKQSHVSYEHIMKCLKFNVPPAGKKFLIIGIVNSALRTGLGDNLVYSCIPRLAKEQGYDKVYMSQNNSPRSQTIYDIVWENNKLLDGKVSQKSLPENVLENVMSQRDYIYENSNLIDMIADSYKLKHDENLKPEIYYTPKKVSEVSKKILWDPNYVTSNHGMNIDKVLEWLRFHKITIDFQFKALGKNAIILPSDICKKTIECKDLFEYADYLNSCKTCVMLLSGGSILSSAINKKSIILYSKSPDVGHKKWMFAPNEYIYIP